MMSSLNKHFELQDKDPLRDSLISLSSHSNQEDLELQQGKKFQDKAKLEMEQRAENEAQQQYSTQLDRIFKLYYGNYILVQQNIPLLYQLPILQPKQMIIWRLIINLLTLFVFFEVPVYVAYGDTFWKTLDSYGKISGVYYMIALLLVVDMGLDFITGYYKHGNLVTDNKKIALNYLYGNFIFDLIALIISISRLSLFIDTYRFVFLMFYFKLPSLLRFDDQLNEMVLLHKRTKLLYEVGKKILFMIFCFNVFCCIFYMIGKFSVESNLQSWLTTKGNFGIIMDLPIHQIYFFSFYFSLGTVSTTMGYGDITPMNIYECSFSLLGVMFAVIVFANNINYFQKMMEEYNMNDFKQYKYKVSINKFMEAKNVPPELQERIRQYLNEYWSQQGTRDQEQELIVFQMLAPELKQELFYSSYGQFLQNTFFHRHFSKSFLKELSNKVIEVNYSTGDIIIEANDSNDDQSYYFIQSGKVIIKSGNSDIFKTSLTQGEGFGELAFLTGQPRTATVFSKEYTQLHKISRQDFLEILNKYPDDYQIYCSLKDNLLFFKDYSYVGQQCWTCKSFMHYAHECPLTHYMPQVQDLIENHTVLDLKQKRMKLERFDRKHWPTRKMSKTLVQGLNKPKLKRMATVMLQTVRNKIIRTNNRNNSEMNNELNILKSESINNEDSLKQLVNDSPDKLQNVESPERDKLNSLQNKLNQFREKQDIKIKKGLDQFDEPANFKFYFKKGNYSNFEAFKGVVEKQQNKQLPIRQSFIPGLL